MQLFPITLKQGEDFRFQGIRYFFWDFGFLVLSIGMSYLRTLKQYFFDIVLRKLALTV